jgi:hypothetical protein
VAFEGDYDWLEKTLEYLKPIKQEQQPAEWSEEDKAFLKVAIAICNRYSHKDIADWLKSLRPQPQQNMSIGFMLYLDEHRPDGKMCLSNAECNEIETAFKNQSWDTILRYAEKYLPHWKPTGYQINSLLAAEGIARANNYPEIAKVLSSLYEQLQKLM